MSDETEDGAYPARGRAVRGANSREYVARMRATLAPLASQQPSARWAFELIARGKAKNGRSLTHEARRVVLDAVLSPAGRACVEDAQGSERTRLLALYEAAARERGAGVAMPRSREPGEDDEERDFEGTEGKEATHAQR